MSTKSIQLPIPQEIRERVIKGFDHLQVENKDPRIQLLRFAQLGIISENNQFHQKHKEGRATFLESHFPNFYLEMVEEGHRYYLLAKMGNYNYGFSLKFTQPPEGSLILKIDLYHKLNDDRLEAYHHSNRYPKETAASL